MSSMMKLLITLLIFSSEIKNEEREKEKIRISVKWWFDIFV